MATMVHMRLLLLRLSLTRVQEIPWIFGSRTAEITPNTNSEGRVSEQSEGNITALSSGDPNRGFDIILTIFACVYIAIYLSTII
ncbi:hypothetical protein FKM82_024602 [Ascaphus truei]